MLLTFVTVAAALLAGVTLATAQIVGLTPHTDGSAVRATTDGSGGDYAVRFGAPGPFGSAPIQGWNNPTLWKTLTVVPTPITDDSAIRAIHGLSRYYAGQFTVEAGPFGTAPIQSWTWTTPTQAGNWPDGDQFAARGSGLPR